MPLYGLGFDQLEHGVFGEIAHPVRAERGHQRLGVRDWRDHVEAFAIVAFGDRRLIQGLACPQQVALSGRFPAQLDQARREVAVSAQRRRQPFLIVGNRAAGGVEGD